MATAGRRGQQRAAGASIRTRGSSQGSGDLEASRRKCGYLKKREIPHDGGSSRGFQPESLASAKAKRLGSWRSPGGQRWQGQGRKGGRGQGFHKRLLNFSVPGSERGLGDKVVNRRTLDGSQTHPLFTVALRGEA